MRKLLLLRGLMGAGKSTFIRENGLVNYAISLDEIRMLLRGQVLNDLGEYGIAGDCNNLVRPIFMKILEERMKVGSLIVVDATHITAKSINQYEALSSTYDYEVIVIDFTDVTLAEAIERNSFREEFKKVPEQVIRKAQENLTKSSVPNFVDLIVKPKRIQDVLQGDMLELNNYKAVYSIGDIHGCFSVLRDFIIEEYNKVSLKEINAEGIGSSELKNYMCDDYFYVFTGDYIDRGIENVETIEFLLSIYNQDNVRLIEGNHEAHLRRYAKHEQSKSREFNLFTAKELDRGGISTKSLLRLCKAFVPMVNFKYFDKEFLVSHGGLTAYPRKTSFIADKDYIKGVGDYNLDVDKIFTENILSKSGSHRHTRKRNVYQIHGHRNLKSADIIASERSFNLEGRVEFGGDLRILKLEKEILEKREYAKVTAIKCKNKVFATPENENTEEVIRDYIEELRGNDSISEKAYGDISSFNFNREVFFEDGWDTANIKARGLYINTKTNNIVARGYDKFFNIGERDVEDIEYLKDNMVFPVTAYLKENGYLGLVGVDSSKVDDENYGLVFTSKSSLTSNHAMYLKEQFFREIDTEEKALAIRDSLLRNNTTLVFEVIEPDRDAHIIDYDNQQIVLIDIAYRTKDFSKYSYKNLKRFANKYGIKNYKKIGAVLEDKFAFERWYERVNEYDFRFGGNHIEGFVIEDSVGYMTKAKLSYYNTWKSLRYMKDRYAKNQLNTGKIRLINDGKERELVEKFNIFLETLSNEELNMDITALRKLFFANYSDLDRIMKIDLNKVIEYAVEKHKGQLRIGGEEYITHPIGVRDLLRKKGINNREILAVALLHDVVEDTDGTFSEIEALTNGVVAEAVRLLTKTKGYNNEEYLKDIQNNKYAYIVKLADRLHNLKSIDVANIGFKKRYYSEVENYYLPFAKGSIFEEEIKCAQQNLGLKIEHYKEK